MEIIPYLNVYAVLFCGGRFGRRALLRRLHRYVAFPRHPGDLSGRFGVSVKLVDCGETGVIDLSGGVPRRFRACAWARVERLLGARALLR